MSNSLLAPAAVLALWTIVMFGWLAAARFPALKKAGIDLSKAPPGGRGADLEGILPPQANWNSHKYTHLMEQPTVFYAVALALAVGGMGGGLNTQIAWAYVGLRILHSLVQVTVNRVMWRFAIFALASLALLALCVHAFMGFVLH